jgi:hypothetical protein
MILDLSNWADSVSVLAESVTNTVTLTNSEPQRFWRLRRGQ